jgi:DNA-binding response OmpR family regulator
MSVGREHVQRVLVVDDDELTSNMLERILRSDGYEVEVASGASDAKAAIDAKLPDLILLDVLLAGDDGLEVLAEVRKQHDVPIIMVTGLADEQDRVLGLRLGADDYIVKPFSYNELTARVAAVLRRSNRSSGGPSPRTFGRLAIDPGAREVRVDGRLIETTAKEFDLLAFLADAPRQVFSRGQLLERVWASSAEWQDPATVTEHVRRLRLKLNGVEEGGWIATVRGVGYRFDPDAA